MVKQSKLQTKPRNPFVASAKFRKAGAHEKTTKAKRRQDRLALNRVVKVLPEQYQKQFCNQNVFATAFYFNFASA